MISQIKFPKSVPEDSILATFDVVGLYSNICHDLGLKAINYWLEKYPEFIPNWIKKTFILEGINIVLTNNLIQFNDQNYIQLKGVAMGTKMAPCYAALTLAFLEEELLYPKIERIFGIESATYFKESYERFLDDCFLIWQKSRGSVNLIQECLNDLNKDLKFTMELNSNEGIHFLDLTVMINKNFGIETDIYIYIIKKLIATNTSTTNRVILIDSHDK